MEGHADTADYGYVEAESAQQACRIVGLRLNPQYKDNECYLTWGLSAKLVK